MSEILSDDKLAPRFVLGHRVRLLPTLGDFAMLEVTTDPGVPGPPPHHHPDFSEFFYVVSGRLEMTTPAGRRVLAPGDACTVAPGERHTFGNPDDAPVTFVTGFSPRGFERFFLDVGVPADQAGAQAQSADDERIAWLQANAAGYGMVMG